MRREAGLGPATVNPSPDVLAAVVDDGAQPPLRVKAELEAIEALA